MFQVRIAKAILVAIVAGWAGFGLADEAGPAGTNGLWFPVGEKLTYQVYWGVIRVGLAEFSTGWRVGSNGTSNIVIRARAKTSGMVNRIFPVDDDVESEVDPATFLPVRFTQILNEGRHHRHDIFTFDYSNRVAVWEAPLKKRTKVVPIGADTRDILTFIYFMRSKGYEVGRAETFQVVTNSKVYDLFVKGIRLETLELGDFGSMECLMVEPRAKFGEIFQRRGQAWLWFSQDERRVCVRMAAKVPVASVKCVLIGVDGPESDAWPVAMTGTPRVDG